MKKLCCAILVSASVLWSCSRTDKVPEIRAGLVNFTSGTVMISGPSGKEFPAKPGDPLADRMTVRTGAKSICEIYFDNTAVRLAENSVLSMQTLFYGKGLSENTGLALRKGESFINAPKLVKGSSFSIKTSTAVAAVRGTEFFVSEGKSSAVSCLSGKVAVGCVGRNGTSETVIGTGEEISAKKGSVAEKNMISSEKLAAFTSRSAVNPLTPQNTETFEKIRACDKDTLDRLKKQIDAYFAPQAGYSAYKPLPPAESAPVSENLFPDIKMVPMAENSPVPALPAPAVIDEKTTVSLSDTIRPQAAVSHIPSYSQPKAEPKAPRQQKKGSTGGQSKPAYESSLPYYVEEE